MRLSAEVLGHIKKWYAKCEEADCMPENGLTIGRLLDTIEALQQENEQLRAQVARMREALECVESDFVDGVGIVACAFCGKENAKERGHQEFCVVGKALISIDTTDYHNPADVEALRKAREALHKGISELKVHCKYFDQTPEEDACIEMHEAVVEIDKAIGGETERGKEG